MKKITLLFLLGMQIVAQTNAQDNAGKLSLFKDKKTKQQPTLFQSFVQYTLSKTATHLTQKPTVMEQRVIGIVDNDDNWLVTDSTWYLYSGNNTSRYDYNFMAYNDQYWPNYFSSYTYPYDMSVMDVNADSSMYYSTDQSVSGSLQLNTITKAHFLPGPVVSDYNSETFGTSSDTNSFYNIYNAAGQLVEQNYLTNQSGTYDSTSKFKLYYDAQGRNTLDSVYTYSLGDWFIYQTIVKHFDANNNIDTFSIWFENGGSWVLGAQFVNEFYSDNKLKMATLFQLYNNVFIKALTDSFEYNSGNDISSAITETQYDLTGGIDYRYKLAKTFNAQNLPDSIFISLYDVATSSWDLLESGMQVYNSYNNPDSIQYYDHSGGSPVYEGSEKYYYEVFNNTTGVNTVANASVKMDIYPNPVSNELNIKWDDANNKRCAIEIVNISGQKLFSYSFIWNNPNQKISFKTLTSGMYWVIVRSESGNVLYRQSIIKQ